MAALTAVQIVRRVIEPTLWCREFGIVWAATPVGDRNATSLAANFVRAVVEGVFTTDGRPDLDWSRTPTAVKERAAAYLFDKARELASVYTPSVSCPVVVLTPEDERRLQGGLSTSTKVIGLGVAFGVGYLVFRVTRAKRRRP